MNGVIECIGTIESDTDVSGSLYLKPEDGTYVVWLKIGTALLEIHPEQLDDTVGVLNKLSVELDHHWWKHLTVEERIQHKKEHSNER